EALFHDRGLANAIYFSAPDVGRDTLTALGLPPHRVAQLTVNRVSSFEELLALVRSVPPERRIEIPNSDPNSNDDHDSIWVQAKLHQLGVLNDPYRMAVFNAAIYEGRRELAGSTVGSSMQALLDAHDVKRLWDVDRPSVAVSFINRLPEERRVALAGQERMSALVARLRAGRVVEMLRGQQLRRALDGEAAAVLGELARTLTVRGGRPAVVIDDERALVEAADQNPLSQSEMRRAFVLWNRRRQDSSLRLTDEESALVTRYEALARDTEAMDDPAMAEALRAARFGEPDLTGNAPGPQNLGSEAEFMHFRLEARARAARGSGSETFDTFNWEGTTVDQRLTEFRQYYAAQ
ncbi:MAG: hypothetical protein EBU70_15600, partial [Actinobacteria bacterium]|nr:hypothetical protein [Actinomycetota bacterium]